MKATNPNQARFDRSFIVGSGGMAERIRSFDWGRHPLGPPENWPQSLKIVIRIMLTSRYAMWLGWSEEFYFFCNDAYLPTVGIKRDWVLGESARRVWAEIWPDIGPRAESVVKGGAATWDEALLLILERSGFREESYHTFSYSPVPDDEGSIGGMLCVVTEDTERILGERRVAALREVAAELDTTRTEEQLLGALGPLLGRHSKDLPFAMIYLFDGDTQKAELACVQPPTLGPRIAPLAIEVGAPDAEWPAHQMAVKTGSVLIKNLADRFQGIPIAPWDKPADQAALVPLMQQGQDHPVGFVVAGLNPYRPFDAPYRGFIELLVGQIAAALSNVRAYEAERKRSQALAELDRAKTDFFSNISHEFRTPLTLMLGPIEDELRRSAGPREGLELAHRNSLRLLKLVNTLLDFSRIEAGRIEANYQPIELAAYTAELASVFRSAVEKGGLQLVVDCPALAEPVYVDREMWEKIVLNLLSNAFKFTFEGEIEVRLRARGQWVDLSINDSGVGIPEGELPKIFERFHRVRRGRARTHEGTGIGLALVKELVDLHRGTVTVQSAENKGTTFTVSLRLGTAHLPAERIVPRDDHSPATSPAGPSFLAEAMRWSPELDGSSRTDHADGAPFAVVGPERSEESRPRILLVEDNADMRDYVHRLLAPTYQVETAADGNAALESIHLRPPDLVLSDAMMPGLDGFGLLQKVRSEERTQSIPFIVLSARAGEEARVDGLGAGADDYLTKPFSARELLARVRSQLEMARLRRRAEQIALEKEQRLQYALDAARMVAWDWDLATGQSFRSANARAILGLEGDRAEDFFERIPPEDRAPLRQKLDAAIEGHFPFQFETRMRLAGNRMGWVSGQAEVVRDVNGKPIRLTGLVLDITERKKADLYLQEAQQKLQSHAAELEKTVARRTAKLQETVADLEHFSYAITHDMRAPLRAMQSFATLLEEEYASGQHERSQDYLRRIKLASERLDQLITDTLSYSKAVRQELILEPVDLDELLQGLVDTYPNLQTDKADISLEPNLPTVLGNKAALTQCFSNLLGNAVKFVQPGTKPKVQVDYELVNPSDHQEPKPYVRVWVKDEGIGISHDSLDRIFGMFERATRGYEGTGIGLAIVRKIVDRLGGRVGVESIEGQGSQFWVELRVP